MRQCLEAVNEASTDNTVTNIQVNEIKEWIGLRLIK
jgi:hypothetical protein